MNFSTLLNEGVYYFCSEPWNAMYGTMEKLDRPIYPDLPRGDALEYDPFWNTEYKEKVSQSEETLIKNE